MLAKATASLDVLTRGRVEIGLGAGAFWEAIEAMGGPRRSPGEAVRSIEEAIEVMRLVWSEQRSLRLDRKSTRLNSSHANISYAVFCLKKKKNKKTVY